MEATAEGRRVAWFLAVALGVANAAGHVLDLHARFWWFGRILHACTVFALTFWLAVGALWEVAEWGFDRIAPGDVIKGKHDTIIDIVMDTLGALLAGVASLNSLRSARTRPAAAPSVAPETP